MKRKKTRLLLAATLSLSVQQALASGICQMPKMFETDTPAAAVDDFKFAFEPLTSKAAPVPNEEIALESLSSESPRLAGALGKVAGIGGAAVGVGLGVWSIKDGLDTGNTEEVVTGGITVGTSVGIPIAVEIVSELAGALAGDVFGGVAGAVITEGFEIYNGVKAEQLIDAAKKQDAELDDKFRAYLRDTVAKMEGSKKFITGDSKFLVEENLKDGADILFNVNKDRVRKVADRLMSEAVEVKAATFEEYYAATGLKSVPDKLPDAFYDWIPYLDESAAQLESKYKNYSSPNLASEGYGPKPILLNSAHMIRQHDINGIDLRAINYSASEYPNQYFATDVHYGDLARWSREVAIQPVIAAVESVFMDDGRLTDQFKTLVQQEMANSSEQQKTLQSRYNRAVKTKLAWYIFGDELLNHLDLTAFNSLEAALWIGRIFTPFLTSFVDSWATSGVVAEVKVAGAVAGMINYLVSEEVDITNITATNTAIHSKVAALGGVPSSLSGAFTTALDKARTRVNAMVIADSQLKSFNYNDSAVQAELSRLGPTYFNDQFKQKVETYLAEFSPEAPLPTPAYAETISPRYPARKASVTQWYALFEESSRLQSDFMGQVSAEIKHLGKRIKNYKSLPGQKYGVDACRFAPAFNQTADKIEALHALYSKQDIQLPSNKWVSFNSIPGVAKEVSVISGQLRVIAGMYDRRIHAGWPGQTCPDGVAALDEAGEAVNLVPLKPVVGTIQPSQNWE
ncbi:hypothetical protein ABU614_00780 [Lysobacter firmicutimachus]|uniref:Uncharacterized protein n=1 Tax=Lysobacter firmicutimachus TaxID=1792846 RepID=A0AAU8MQF2_9GAMM